MRKEEAPRLARRAPPWMMIVRPGQAGTGYLNLARLESRVGIEMIVQLARSGSPSTSRSRENSGPCRSPSMSDQGSFGRCHPFTEPDNHGKALSL